MAAMLADEVVVPHRPEVPGLRFRRFRGPADYPGMVAANQATRDDAGVEEVITVEGIANNYDHLVNCDKDDDILIVERHDRIIGYARVEWRDLTDGTRGRNGDFSSSFGPLGPLPLITAMAISSYILINYRLFICFRQLFTDLFTDKFCK